ncbi:hypothetical protein GCM10007036_21220 [Alsobacter metallidurans]|uniref:Response regulatory domain-containing protein n=1 Tax=Alsobacter metallidurans TaxID=340221 RepID=A0A917MJM7_9HYPH|nr:response regulator transcription factor [Alsobacter metallidurans]GGH18807.1 hypothetical protein GCM10007036_21220 [Alsobacter metallidurans]
MISFVNFLLGRVPIRVVVLDDRSGADDGPAATLRCENDIAVVGRSGPGRHIVELIRKVRPDVVVVDLTAPGARLATIARLAASCPEASVLLLAPAIGPEHMEAAYQLGIGGCLLDNSKAEDLGKAIRRIARGEQANDA